MTWIPTTQRLPGMSVRRYEQGRLVAGYVPLELPQTPWYTPPPPPPAPASGNTETKYRLESLAVGQSLYVPYGNAGRSCVAERVRVTITKRGKKYPERFTTKQTPEGVKVTRIS